MVKDNVVTFIKETGETLNGTVVANSENTLKVMTPSELSPSDKVQVQVQVNNQKPSNTVTLSRSTKAVIFEFSDNGPGNDDTFTLFVDGKLIYSMPEPMRNTGPISLELTPGRHLVMLRGIGTYSLKVTGYVDDLSNFFTTKEDTYKGGTTSISIGGITFDEYPVQRTVDLTAGVETYSSLYVGDTARSPWQIGDDPGDGPPATNSSGSF